MYLNKCVIYLSIGHFFTLFFLTSLLIVNLQLLLSVTFAARSLIVTESNKWNSKNININRRALRFGFKSFDCFSVNLHARVKFLTKHNHNLIFGYLSSMKIITKSLNEPKKTIVNQIVGFTSCFLLVRSC